MKRRHTYSAWLFALGCWAVIFVGGGVFWLWSRDSHVTATPEPMGQSSAQLPKLTAQTAGYVLLAKQIADPLNDRETYKEPRPDYANTLAQAQLKVARLRAIQSPDAMIQTTSEYAAGAGQRLIESSDALTLADQQDGFKDILTVGFGLYAGDLRCIFSGASSLIDQQSAKNQARVAWVLAFNKARACVLMLPDLAQKYSGPVSEDNFVKVDFDESFLSLRNHDVITFTNTSNQVLTNCTIKVVVSGQSGDSTPNVHFVESWRPGQSLSAWYGPGIEANGTVYGRQTALGVREVSMTVWSDQATVPPTLYRYVGAERDRDVQHELDSTLKMDSDFHVHQFLTGGPTISLMPRGAGVLPPHTLTMQFVRAPASGKDELSYTKSWSGSLWPMGEIRKFDLDGKLEFQPDYFELALTFPECRSTYRIRLPAKKS